MRLICCAVLLICVSALAFATPTTQFWTPATIDVQPPGTTHLTHDEPTNPRDPIVLLRINECSEKALRQLSNLLPADIDGGYDTYGRQAVEWLGKTYGFYMRGSEGDSWWVYDKRALREFLNLYPHHLQADDVAYELMHYDISTKFDPTTFWIRSPQSIVIAKQIITDHEKFLKRYPKTDKRAEAKKHIAQWRKYVKSNVPVPAY